MPIYRVTFVDTYEIDAATPADAAELAVDENPDHELACIVKVEELHPQPPLAVVVDWR